MRYFILDANKNIVAADRREWMLWFEKSANRLVAQSQCGTFMVGTVFLGIDHTPLADRPPLLFETIVFANDGSIVDQNRWKTWKEAEDGHVAIARRLGGARS